MSPEKAQQLIDICPDIFRPMSPDYAFDMFGFECGDGWFDLLKELIEGINFLMLDVCDQNASHGLKVHQVKEKYGTLRFYVSRLSDSVDELIKTAEYRSSVTCETCGGTAHTRATRGWYFTLCDQCAPEEWLK